MRNKHTTLIFTATAAVAVILSISCSKNSMDKPKSTSETQCVISQEDTEPPPVELETIKLSACVPDILPLSVLDTSFKTWMDYRAITNKKSKQWALQRQAVTDKQGFRRLNGFYMVAVGSYYADKVGITVEVTLDTGTVFKAVVGDLKADKHTDVTHRYCVVDENRYNVVEFIIDRRKLPRWVRRLGDVSPLGLRGNVIEIERIG